ncbi:hypothetical protein P9597_05580 [Aneurinibacillus migulanus]|uniref:hypothetical protein n=1 Tax=Aneurinibacillus migulanus TaxID=47500 RepID=UPI002E24EFDD|nr:hypothetical protein [Aneurinibacillus migulanus]
MLQQERLSMLRRNQYILLNAFTLLFLLIFFVIIHLFPSIPIQFIFSIAFFCNGILLLLPKGAALGPLYFFPSMRELYDYTEAKRGTEGKKARNIAIPVRFGVGALFLYQALVFPIFREPQQYSGIFFVICVALAFILINVILYFQNRKLDRSTPEQLKGYIP